MARKRSIFALAAILLPHPRQLRFIERPSIKSQNQKNYSRLWFEGTDWHIILSVLVDDVQKPNGCCRIAIFLCCHRRRERKQNGARVRNFECSRSRQICLDSPLYIVLARLFPFYDFLWLSFAFSTYLCFPTVIFFPSWIAKKLV
jgi:hypothetical protein